MLLLRCLIAFALFCGMARAEDDAMEMQRCVWRCLANSKGADDPAYSRCVQRRCSEEKKPKAREKTRSLKRSDAPGPDQWVYGEHPRLGLSAHVVIGTDALGFACHRSVEPSGYSVTTRLTENLASLGPAPGEIAMVWTGPFAPGGEVRLRPAPKGLFELDESYCLSMLPQSKRSSALLLLRERFHSLRVEGGRNIMTVEGAAGRIELGDESDLIRLANAVEVPLKGATVAIRQLAAACPALKREMAEGCEVD